MIILADKYHCTGCEACYNICPKSAIGMEANAEGFLMPSIDSEKCIECKMCVKHCPALNPLTLEATTSPTAYAMISKHDRNTSSSGGAFSVFAKYILSEGGVVFGATIDNQLQVYHTFIESVDELFKLKGSKYVQSEIGNTYKEAKSFLRSGRKVLFSGTPCQIAGLYKFLGKRYDDLLITLDLVCHGVPSSKTFDRYLEKLRISFPIKNGIIESFRFRKLDSWDYRPAVKFTETKWKALEQSDNAYMAAFFRGWIFRECCYNCQYANLHRTGTFTIADFWGIGKYGTPFRKNVSAGVSLVIDNFNKMESMMQILESEAYVERRNLDEALHENHNLSSPVERPEQRDTVIKDLIGPMSLSEFAHKYKIIQKENLVYYLKKISKNIIYRLGIYNIYKTISYKLK